MIAPGSATDAETFLWRTVSPRLRLGVGYLHKQGAFRALAGYQFSPERANVPSLNGSIGVQGIGTGNPGYSLTLEKNLHSAEASLNLFAGLGARSNEDHIHGVGGFKVDLHRGLTLGLQLDGHQTNPFLIVSRGQAFAGIYLVDLEQVAYLVGARF